MHTLPLLGVGLAAGIASGLLGIGGGLIIVPGLLFLTKLSMPQAIGTSLVIIVPTAIVGALSHHQFGNVVWGSVLFVVIGAALGSFLGATLAHLLPAALLKKGFALFLLFIAWKLFFGQ